MPHGRQFPQTARKVSAPDQRDLDRPSRSRPACSPSSPRAPSSPSIGDTIVLATANAASGVREGIDFFPLTVDVEERMYAAGKIPGSFFRREGRPSDTAILTARLIDRPLRPSFADGYRNETQVVVTVLGADLENPHDVLAINAASAALMLSGIPFEGPDRRGAHRLQRRGRVGPHPTYQDGDESAFELVVAGRQLDDGDVAIMMVEAGGTEGGLGAVSSPARRRSPRRSSPRASRRPKIWIRESIDLQRELVAEAGQPAAAAVSSRRSTTARTSPSGWPRSAPTGSTR